MKQKKRMFILNQYCWFLLLAATFVRGGFDDVDDKGWERFDPEKMEKVLAPFSNILDVNATNNDAMETKEQFTEMTGQLITSMCEGITFDNNTVTIKSDFVRLNAVKRILVNNSYSDYLDEDEDCLPSDHQCKPPTYLSIEGVVQQHNMTPGACIGSAMYTHDLFTEDIGEQLQADIVSLLFIDSINHRELPRPMNTTFQLQIPLRVNSNEIQDNLQCDFLDPFTMSWTEDRCQAQDDLIYKRMPDYQMYVVCECSELGTVRVTKKKKKEEDMRTTIAPTPDQQDICNLCSCSGSKVDCNNKGLKSVPENIPQSTTYLNLHGNQLTSLGNSSFKSLTNLQTLRLERNSITFIEVGTFATLTKLANLQLDGNSITFIEVGTFATLTKLEHLYLHNNSLTTLEPTLLHPLKSLITLYVDGNQLKSLEPDTFATLTKLQFLYLHNNNLTSLGPTLLRPLISLRYLFLHGNQLKSFKPDTFATLTKLEYLYLNNNSLTTLEPDTFTTLTKLQYLHLGNNMLTRLEPTLLRPLQSLRYLIVNGNQLKSLEPKTFDSLTNLRSLNLDDNGLTFFNTTLLKSLVYLNYLYLENNNIKHFDSGLLDPRFRLLSSLDLRNNQLTSLDPAIFNSSAHRNVRLNLRGNPFICTCQLMEAITNIKVFITYSYLSNCTDKRGASIPMSLNEERRICDDGSSPQPPSTPDICSLCYCSGSTVYCNNKGLKSVPENIPQSTTHLYLYGNQLTSLGNSSFKSLTNLQTLGLDRNSITFIEVGTFATLTKLERLYLQYNNLTSIEQTLLHPLKSLRYLYIYRNQLKSLEPGTFATLMKLESLHLHNNSLTTLQPALLHPLKSLIYLYIYGNQLKTLEPDTFATLTKLKSLYVNRNQLKSLEPKTFDSLTNLRSLNLGDNALTFFNTTLLKSLVYLNYLHLQNNNIKHFDSGLLDPRLSYIGFDNNQLTSLDPATFNSSGLWNLRLYLRNNPFNCTCQLMEAITNINRNIRYSYLGNCTDNRGDNISMSIMEKRRICKGDCHPMMCTADYTPVCGTDGNTYSNKCNLQNAKCTNPSLHLEHEGQCKAFVIVEEKKTWEKAEEHCTQMQGHLATVTSEEDHTKLLNLIKKSKFSENWWWIGLNDREREGTWEWVSGDKSTYRKWASNEPSGTDCLCVHKPDNDWHDCSCTQVHGFVCQRIVPRKNFMTTTTKAPPEAKALDATSSSIGWGFGPKNAIDSNRDTFFHSTDNENNPWLQVRFAQTVVSGIYLTSRHGKESRLKNIVIRAGKSMTPLDNPIVGRFDGPGVDGSGKVYHIQFTKPVITDRVIIQIEGKGTLNIAEVKVITAGKNFMTTTTKAPPEAKVFDATSSSTGWGYGPKNAIDSNPETFFHSADNENNPWLQVRFAQTTVSGIYLTNSGYRGEGLKNIVVRAGNSIKPLDNPVVGRFDGPGVSGKVYHIQFTQPVIADRVTIQIEGKGTLRIAEVKVITVAQPLGPMECLARLHQMSIRKNQLVDELPFLDKEYDISFEVYPSQFGSNWRNILYMTVNDQSPAWENHQYGSYLPTVTVNPTSYGVAKAKVSFCNAINGRYDHCRDSVIENQEWTKFRFTQKKERYGYMFRVHINDNKFHEVENKDARVFRDVKVYVGNKWNEPQPGFVRNLKIMGHHREGNTCCGFKLYTCAKYR